MQWRTAAVLVPRPCPGRRLGSDEIAHHIKKLLSTCQFVDLADGHHGSGLSRVDFQVVFGQSDHLADILGVMKHEFVVGFLDEESRDGKCPRW